MTAHEIREIGFTHDISALTEIAAQLADLNQAMRPRWVSLPVSDGGFVSIDARKVFSITAYPDSEKEYTVLNDDYKETRIIFAPVAEVKVKLGVR